MPVLHYGKQYPAVENPAGKIRSSGKVERKQRLDFGGGKGWHDF
jgi:hypothetical protein